MNEDRTLTPLCVDLDGTLLKTDISLELVFKLLGLKPFQAPFLILFWLTRGLANLKFQLASRVSLSREELVFNQDIIKYCREQKARGREVLLVTGSSQVIADQVAAFFPFFDRVFASTPNSRLVGKNKRDLLIKEFGDKNFDYIGNEPKDNWIWSHCHKTLVVTSDQKLKQLRAFDKIFDPENTSFWAYLFSLFNTGLLIRQLLVFFTLCLLFHYRGQMFFHFLFASFFFDLAVQTWFQLTTLAHTRRSTKDNQNILSQGDLYLQKALKGLLVFLFLYSIFIYFFVTPLWYLLAGMVILFSRGLMNKNISHRSMSILGAIIWCVLTFYFLKK
jgi:hypothetical protein